MSIDPPTPDQIAFDLITQLRGGGHPPSDASRAGPWQAVILGVCLWLEQKVGIGT